MPIWPAKTCPVCGTVWQPSTRYQAGRNTTCGTSCANRLRSGSKVDRIIRKVTIGNGCWEWQGALIGDGYGNIWDGTASKLAHRVVYELLVGPIPEGLTLDHLCRNRRCVRPRHLEPVTMKENMMRGESFAARNAVKTLCPRGHALTGENVYVWPGSRFAYRKCRTCARERQQRQSQ